MARFGTAAVVVLYVGYVFIVTLYPFEWLDDPRGQSGTGWFSALQGDWRRLLSKDLLINVLLFVPCGVLIYCALKSSARSKIVAIGLAALFGACISSIIEWCQVFLSRTPQATDVLSNTVGTGCGAILSAAMPRTVADVVCRLWGTVERSWITLCAVVLLGVSPFILSIVQFVAPFRTWDSRYTLQIGNEATLDKPWLGKIYLVALYSQALSANEVAKKFHRGVASGLSKTDASGGLVALYTFNERRGDTVHDKSSFKEPLDLIISSRDRVRWLESSDGLEILQPAILRSQQAGMKLVNAISATSELSIEVWLTPGNTVQRGPARIVSLSADPARRNFTLGQEKANIEFRIHTPVVITNRSPLVLTSKNALTTLERSHVVVTYKDGVERLYLNGKPQSEVVDLTEEGIVGFGTRKTAVAQLAYGFFYFVPVSLFLSRFLSQRSVGGRKTLLLSFAVGIGLLMVTELFQAFAFDRGADIPLLGYGLIIATLGALMGEPFLYVKEEFEPRTP